MQAVEAHTKTRAELRVVANPDVGVSRQAGDAHPESGCLENTADCEESPTSRDVGIGKFDPRACDGNEPHQGEVIFRILIDADDDRGARAESK